MQQYRRVYEKSGFCSIRCGSKWNIEHGISDAWKKSQLGVRSGKNVPCDECNKPCYIVEHQYEQQHHFCDKKCKGTFFGRMYAGKGNPMYGRKLSEESLKKQKRTLLQNHGVTNAYFLSKRSTVSKAQREILSYLTGTLPTFEFEGEKFFSSGSYRYFIDIFSEKLKMVVEYNGDYWHCNPLIYSGTFFHPKKMKSASEIWKEDKERMTIIEQKGYRTFTVWETEYHNNKSDVLNRLVQNALSCSGDFHE
jgi:very-short-patch-repair endonuclease/endogenous inhibitor of DNA gyrase (YacG/DUF329 family)